MGTGLLFGGDEKFQQLECDGGCTPNFVTIPKLYTLKGYILWSVNPKK